MDVKLNLELLVNSMCNEVVPVLGAPTIKIGLFVFIFFKVFINSKVCFGKAVI